MHRGHSRTVGSLNCDNPIRITSLIRLRVRLERGVEREAADAARGEPQTCVGARLRRQRHFDFRPRGRLEALRDKRELVVWEVTTLLREAVFNLPKHLLVENHLRAHKVGRTQPIQHCGSRSTTRPRSSSP